jgi:hypothetical protein
MVTRTKSTNVTKVTKSASNTGTDPVGALQAVEKATRKETLLTPAERKELRAAVAKAPQGFLNLVFSFAEQSGGTIGSLSIDSATMQQDLADAAHLMLGVSAARNVARRLEDAALAAGGGVAKRALWALQSLETEAKTPEGSGLAQKAAELRAEVRKTRKAKAKPAADTVEATETPPATTEAATVAAAATK